jgi:hypothetical protein
MSQRNEHLELVMDELERYGLRGEVGERGKHLEIAFETPLGRRFIIMPKTPSDWRGAMNSRSDLRKILRKDNLQPKVISQLSFQKAMSLPKPQAMPPELILQKDVNELIDLVFELQSQFAAIQELNAMLINKMSTAKVTSTIQFGEEPLSEANDLVVEIEKKFPVLDQVIHKEGPFREGTMQARIFSCLTEQYQSAHDIVKQSGANLKFVATTLSTIKKRGFAEIGLRGMWRRKV